MLRKHFLIILLVAAASITAESDSVTEESSPPNTEETTIALIENLTIENKKPESLEEKTTEQAEEKKNENIQEKNNDTDSLKTKTEGPQETKEEVDKGAPGLTKLAELLNIESTTAAESELKNEKSSNLELQKNNGNDSTEKNEQPVVELKPQEVKVPHEVKISQEPSTLAVKGQEKENPTETHSSSVMKLEKTADLTTQQPALNPNGAHNVSDLGNKPHHVDIHVTSSYSASNAKPPADHKMTPLEQNAYICSLPKMEEDLCPMTINLEENVGISDPGANAYCNDVIAAPMGYKGVCIALMKTNPETGLPIYTKTCAYFDKDRRKCATNFLTSQSQTNSSQVKFNCENNGFTNYIPTSCVNKVKNVEQ